MSSSPCRANTMRALAVVTGATLTTAALLLAPGAALVGRAETDAPLAVPQVRVRMYEGIVEGLGQPLGAVTVTIASSTQPEVYSWPLRAGADGAFRVLLQPGTPGTVPPCDAFPRCYETIPLVPGDRVTVDVAAGDPTVLTLPPLSTRTDADAETVSGRAPRGAEVRLFVGPPWPMSPADDAPGGPAPVATAIVDADGAFAASLAPAVDIEPPLRGYAVVDVRGNSVAAEWAPLVVTSALDEAYVEAAGVVGRPISATLRAADGRVVGRLDTYGRQGSLRDDVGERPVVSAGDVLVVQRGDDRVTLPIPVLGGRVHVDDDLVVGQAPPGASFTLRYGAVAATVTADAAGLFRHDYRADGIDLRFNESLVVEIAAGSGGRHTLRRIIGLPGMTLALHTSELRGAIEPLLDLTVGATRGAEPLARQTIRSDGRAAFRAALSGADGRRLALAPGDRLTVEAPPPALQRLLTMAVPTLAIDLDAGDDTTSGRMPTDASLSLTLGHWFLSDDDAGVRGWQSPVPDAAGAWTAAFASGGGDRADIRPGSTVDAELRLPTGHVVERRVALPMLSAQVDGTLVCGQAAPLADVAVTAVDAAGATALAGAGAADADGLFAFALADVDGRGRTMAPGTRVRGRLGAEDVALVVPPLRVGVDWGSGAVTLATSPKAEVTVEVGAHGCLGREVGAAARYDSRFGRADEAGRAEVNDFLPDQAAAGVVAAAFTADGMRAYREARRLVADLYVDTPRLVVTTTARTRVRAELHTADGRSNGAVAVTDDAGRADLELADTAGQPVRLTAGQTLYIDPESDGPRILVEPLSFDVSSSRGIDGLATPGRDVALRLTLADGRAVAFVRRTDDRGRFVFTPFMVPPRSAWRWADVRRVEAAIALAGGHRVVSDAALEAGADRGRIWLPYGHTGGRR